MTAAGQDTTRPAAGGQRREREIEVEVEEILPGHLDYRDGQGRAFHVWTVTTAGAGSKYGLGKLSEAQLRELGRQIGHLLGPAGAGPEGDQGRNPASRDGTGSGARASD
jgi:hypothetical protein